MLMGDPPGPANPRRHRDRSGRTRVKTQLEEAMSLKEDQTLSIDLSSNEDIAQQAATVLGPSLPGGESGRVVV